MKYSVLFICLGNICRSPVARAVFEQLVAKHGYEKHFEIDSCGTGDWHIGEQAHPETTRVAKRNGVSLDSHRARQLTSRDFTHFDLLITMDTSNLRDAKRVRGASKAEIVCLREYDPDAGEIDVPDPYYGGKDGFQIVHDIVHRCCSALLDELEEELKLTEK